MKTRILKSLTCFALATTLAIGPAALRAQNDRPDIDAAFEDKGADMLFDTVVVRPLSLAATVLGLGAWVVSLPFSIPGGNMNEVGKELIYKPGEYTFGRALGEWDECGLDKHPC